MSQSPRSVDKQTNGSRRSSPAERSPSPKRRSRSRSSSKKKERYYSRSRSGSRKGKDNRYYSRSLSRSPEVKRRRYSRYSRSRSKSPSPYRSRGRRYGNRRRSYSRSPMSSRRRHTGNRVSYENPEESRVLGVFGLSIYTTEKELHHILSKYGPLEKVVVVLDAQTGRSRGFAFVYFENTADATSAKEHCTGMEIDGRRIRVDYSITHRAHTPTPGIYMGRPTKGGGYRRSPSPYYKRRRGYDRYSDRRYRYDDRSRSRSYSPYRYRY